MRSTAQRSEDRAGCQQNTTAPPSTIAFSSAISYPRPHASRPQRRQTEGARLHPPHFPDEGQKHDAHHRSDAYPWSSGHGHADRLPGRL
jgi:hypothetical protein